MAPRSIGCFGLAILLVSCTPVAYLERPAPFLGTRKRTLAVGEAALRAAMAEAGIKKVEAPGNEEPVMVNSTEEGAPVCLTGAWFTLAGPPNAMLGDRFQYAWKLCADGKTATLAINCMRITVGEMSTDSRECEGGRIAYEAASRTDRLLGKLSAAK